MLEFEPVFITKLVETIIHFHKFHAIKLPETIGGYDKMKISFREEGFGDYRRNQWHSGIITTAFAEGKNLYEITNEQLYAG